MKRVRINIGKVGIVTRRGVYKKILSFGMHMVGLFDNVTTYDQTKIYASGHQFDLMLLDPEFEKMVESINVKDDEVVMRFVNGNFQEIMMPGRHFYFKGLMNYTFVTVDLNNVYLSDSMTQLMINIPEIIPYTRRFDVDTFEKGLLFVNGEFIRILDSGTYYFINNEISVMVINTDMRKMQMEISGQEMLTNDKANLRMNFFAQYQVVNIEKALLESKDFSKQLYVIIQLALRAYIGKLTLDELLENKSDIGQFITDMVREDAEKLGVVILNSGIRDVILPGEMKDIMNSVLVAQKQAQANTIMRREDTASTRNMLNTAKLMESNAMLFKLKEMEYVEKIADKIGNITVSGGGQLIDQLRGIFSSS